MRKLILLLILLFPSLFVYNPLNAQIISVGAEENDTLLFLVNDSIVDYSGVFIGNIDVDGKVYNSNSEVIGKILENEFYDVSMAKIATFNSNNGELMTYEGIVLGLVSETEIRDPNNNLKYLLVNTNSIKAAGILFFFFK